MKVVECMFHYCIDVVFKLRFHSDATQFYLKYKKNSIWMSECLLTTSGQLFSYIMARTSYILMRLCPLCKNPRIDMSLHSDTLPTQPSISVFGLTRPGLEPTIYRTCFVSNVVCVSELSILDCPFGLFKRFSNFSHYYQQIDMKSLLL